jgi:hypothetical protein
MALIEAKTGEAPARPKTKRTLHDQAPASASENLDWFLANAQFLLREYPDHWLAIKDKKVIAANESVKALREHLVADARSRCLVVRSKAGSTTVPQ